MGEQSDNTNKDSNRIPFEAVQAEFPDWADSDTKAQEEDKQWDELEETKRKNDKNWLALYGWVILIITLVFALTFLGALIAWTWHYLAPSCWHWLDPHQLSKIQSVLFSGGMGAIISGIIRSQLNKAE